MGQATQNNTIDPDGAIVTVLSSRERARGNHICTCDRENFFVHYVLVNSVLLKISPLQQSVNLNE